MQRMVSFLLSMALAGASGTAWADCDCGYPTRASHPCSRCVQHRDGTAVQGEKGLVEQQSAAPTGAYAAPPRTGTQAGETRALGIEGMAIEFPALRLKLPSIRLPALTRYRTGPRMLVDESVAGYVTDFREEMTFDAGSAQQQQVGPQQADKANSSLQKVEDLTPPPPPEPFGRRLTEDPTESHAAWERLEAEYRQRLERMEEMEQRLEAQMQRMAELIADLENKSSPAPVSVAPAD